MRPALLEGSVNSGKGLEDFITVAVNHSAPSWVGTFLSRN
jgi:hypothetical protein